MICRSMGRSCIARWFVASCLAVSLLPNAIAQPTTEVPGETIPANWEFDFDLFHWVLEQQGLESRNHALDTSHPEHWNEVLQTPSKAAVILTGDIREVSNWRTLHSFLSHGGVILVATNKPVNVRGFFSIDFGPVTTSNRLQSWHGHHDCLQVVTTSSSSSRASLTSNVSTIVTNRSGWISHLNELLYYDWSTLAKLPSSLKPRESSGQPLVAMAVSNRNSAGRLIVVADGSPLSNGMLWHGDNLILLTNFVQELTEDKRTEFVFLHDGQAVGSRADELLLQEVARQMATPPEIPPEALADLPAEALLEIGNTLATSIEDSDVFNEVATDRPRSLADRFYRRAILLSVCAAALAFFLIRSWLGGQVALPWQRQPRRPEPREPPASLASMNYVLASQALSRDTCRFLTGSQMPKDWLAQLQPNGSAWQRLYAQSPAPHATADTIAQVLSWGTDGAKNKLSRPDFERFGKSIHQLKELHQP